MAAPTIGSLAVAKKPRLQYVKGSGWRVVLQYEGTDTALDAISLGSPLEVTRDGEGPFRTLTASYTADAAGNVDPDGYELTWEFGKDATEKSIFQFCSNETIAALIKKQISAIEDGTTTVAAALTALNAAQADIDDLAIFNLYWKGVDGFPYEFAVLHMALVFDKYSTNTNVSYINTNRCYTLAALLDENPSLLNEPVTLSDGYWLKKMPVTAPATGGKYLLTQDWVFTEDYAQFFYGAPIDVV